MRTIKLTYPAIALALILASNGVWARSGGHGGHSHGHSHSHLSIGLGYYGPGFYGGYGYGGYGFGGYGFGYPFYYPPYYSYPQTVIVPTTPPVYIQQQAQPTQQAQPQTNYWYYCRDPDGYYPYVKTCPGGWLQVAPQPPGQ